MRLALRPLASPAGANVGGLARERYNDRADSADPFLIHER
jgi:hypothetical protein